MTARRLTDPSLIGIVLLGSVLLLVLAMEGGGYGPGLRNQIGILAWWLLALGVIVGLLPLRLPGPVGLSALAAFTLFVIWAGVSLIWTESSERTLADLGRLATYLGIFALALSIYSRHSVRRIVTAVGFAIVAVAAIALVTRLFPGLPSDAAETARLLPGSANRQGFPLNYWNGLGALMAVGIPLMLFVATSARSRWAQSAAAAALPVLVLTLFLTYSRSAVGGAVIAVVLFFMLCGDRLPRLITLVVTGLGASVLIYLASGWEFVAEGQASVSGETGQGTSMLLVTLAVGMVVGLTQLWLSGVLPGSRLLERARPSRAVSIWASAGAVVFVVAVGLAFSVPDRAADAWNEFKNSGSIPATGAGRLQSLSGSDRYQYWEVAVEQNQTRPLTGRGSGTFEFWTNRSEDTTGFVRDAHSLYLETLGELGIIGLVLLLTFFGIVLVGGGIRTMKSSTGRKPQMAAALSACATFMVIAAVDWTWELAVVPVAFLLLASALVTAGDPSGRLPSGTGWKLRLPVALASLVAIVFISIPLASSSLLQRSEEAVRDGDLAAALDLARQAESVEPSAASPRLQQALILELSGSTPAGLAAAREATEREPTNWRTWLVRFRLEAANGETGRALSSFERARELNPNSPLFRGLG